MAELKPCPFCGGEVALSRNYQGQWRIHCLDCEAIVWVGENQHKISVQEAWNRRVENEQRRF